MHVFITGASGLIGRQLASRLEKSGHQVTALTRRTPVKSTQKQWNPKAESLDQLLFDECDVLVHLAGENIAEGRWNADKKRRIRDSRVNTTSLLARTIAGMQNKPRAFIVASAIGYYGDRGDDILTEESAPGTGFLAEVCQAWEAAAEPAREAGIRTAHVRTGVVLAKAGGALAKMLTPFKLGGGGIIGSGRQYWSWITLDDIARLYQFAIENETVHGPLNGTAPSPCTNGEFTKTLGRVISRPTIIPMPAFLAKLALGEMAEALILASARVLPQQPEQAGFEFQQVELESALRSLNL